MEVCNKYDVITLNFIETRRSRNVRQRQDMLLSLSDVYGNDSLLSPSEVIGINNKSNYIEGKVRSGQVRSD